MLETLKKIWKNEYIQTIITIVILVAFVFGFWRIIQFALGTEYPALAVASESMLPTLNVGDLIIVQGVNPEQINAKPTTGDIIVFKKSNNDLVVHRAIDWDGHSFTTKGDNNLSPDAEKVDKSAVVGRVIEKIPYVGNLALIMHTAENMYLFIIILIILMAIIIIFPFEEEKASNTTEKASFWKRIPTKTIYFATVNVLLICLIIFSLWGAFTFWNPGAGQNGRGEYVSLYGMYSDVQFHESFKNTQQISRVELTQGFLVYAINCEINGELRTGVPTFSWAQAAVIGLLAFDIWELIKILKKRKLEFKIKWRKSVSAALQPQQIAILTQKTRKSLP
ncbi:MAG: signal peptidase I [Candidatus Bathyarchaeia archaeon]